VSDSTGSKHDPLAALRQRGFLWFSLSRFSSAVAQTGLAAVLMWEVYRLNGSPLDLATLGIVRFVPQLIAALYAGAVADTYNRKGIVLVAQAVAAACAIAFLVTSVSGIVTLPIIYGLAVVLALAQAFDAPARQSLLPSVVRPETFQNAITVSSTVQSLAFVSGPGLAGVLLATGGVAAAYGATVVMLLVAMVGIVALRPKPVSQPPRAVTWAAIREGLAFVRTRQPLLGSMTLDMFAVVFGGAQAMLPIYARDILQVGEVGYGILASSMNAGALLMSVVLIMMPSVHHLGRTLLFSVAAFGLATMAFGLSRSFPLSVAMYMAVGMADQMSVVMRQTTIQLSTPDYLRGRVTAVGQLFIGTSNQLGAVESGLVAAATNATFAVVSGGAACLVVVGVIAARMRELRTYTMDDVMAGARRDEAATRERAAERAAEGEAAGG
jgi:MFS family permease